MKFQLTVSARLLPLLLVASGSAAQQHCELVPIDGGSVRACISGHGVATVVLAAGAGQSSGTWSRILPELEKYARVITFDRPGFGGSQPGVPPRTPTRIARELSKVVDSFGVEDPLVLVGHSMGGVHVLRYATLFPKKVAGVAILDTPPPGFEQERLSLLSPAEAAQRERLLDSRFASAPEAVRLERAGARPAGEWEFADFPNEVRLLVVVADSQDFGDLGSESAHRELWLERSRQWLQLSDHSELLVAEGGGHMIHQDRPAVVIEAIRRLLAAAVRDGATDGKMKKQ